MQTTGGLLSVKKESKLDSDEMTVILLELRNLQYGQIYISITARLFLAYKDVNDRRFDISTKESLLQLVHDIRIIVCVTKIINKRQI
jgi:hypothetical protein